MIRKSPAMSVSLSTGFIALTISLPLTATLAATMDTPCGKISVEDHCMTMPNVQSVSAASTPVAGQQVSVQCTYVGGAKKFIDHPDTTADKALHASTFQLPLQIRAGGVIILKKNIAIPSEGASYNVSAPWIPGPQHAGKAVVLECLIDPEKKIHYSAKQANVNVPGKPAPTAILSNQPPQAVTAIPALVLPRPKLAVSAAQAHVQQNCQSPQPALIVHVKITNTGGPLAAGKGHVYVKETGGTNLSSGGVAIPAIPANDYRGVAIPVITLGPYSALAGNHQLAVHMNTVTSEGKESFEKPATPYLLTASFPAGHCGAATKQPGRLRGLPKAP